MAQPGLASLAIALALLAASCGNAPKLAWTRSVPVTESVPKPLDLLAYPADGQTVQVNPPGFCWTPSENTKKYRLEVRKAGESGALMTADASSTVYPPSSKLEPGEYEWQVLYLDQGGAPSGVSKTRRFKVPANAPELVMPDVEELKAKLAGVRPRMFLSGDRLKQIQDLVAKNAVPSWPVLKAAADGALAEKSYPEPEGYRKGIDSGEEWNRTFTPGKVGSAHLARTALVYKITGDPKYLEGAKRWMLTLASWNPRGITSHRIKQPDGTQGNDEASMPMLERMSFAWDWIGDKFTPEERKQILRSITERGNQVLAKLEEEDFLSHPYNNHEGRALAFLGEAGLSFLGDIPDAERWLDYVLRCYLTSYPAWGGDEGGWAQGLNYWSIYVFWHTGFLQALRETTGVDVYKRPFYRNTGYLPVYFHAPYAPTAAFGDAAYNPPSEVEMMLIDHFADVNHDPVLKWQANQLKKTAQKNLNKWREWYVEDLFATLRSIAPDFAGAPPTSLDGSRHFRDIGWVAMHSAPGDADNDVWAMFKASRFGSFSHSHADQNSFILSAYGHALAIDSGYYPAYGTPHDTLWTRQTRAHNTLLVNGRGQPTFRWEANGEIEKFEQSGPITVARGQAANAYNVPQEASVANLWKKLLKEPLPPMEPKVESFGRTLAFVSSKTRPVLIVHDVVKTSAPTTFDWLLHALNQMETDSKTGAIYVRDGDVRMTVRLISTAPFKFSQDSRFPIAPEKATNTAYVMKEANFPDQWHLEASTQAPAQEVKFLAVFVPYRASEKVPEIVPLKSGDTVGFRIAATEVQASWPQGQRKLIVKATENGKTSQAVVE